MSDIALQMADELDRLGSQYDSEIAAELRRLVAENDALRADAERYRWLRDNTTNYGLTQEDGYGGRELKGWEELDAAIDAARSRHD